MINFAHLNLGDVYVHPYTGDKCQVTEKGHIHHGNHKKNPTIQFIKAKILEVGENSESKVGWMHYIEF